MAKKPKTSHVKTPYEELRDWERSEPKTPDDEVRKYVWEPVLWRGSEHDAKAVQRGLICKDDAQADPDSNAGQRRVADDRDLN